MTDDEQAMTGVEDESVRSTRRRQLHPASSLLEATPEARREDRSSRSPRRGSEPRNRAEDDPGENLHRTLRKLVEDELAKHVRPDLLKVIRKYTTELAAKIDSLQKTNEKLVQTKSDLEVVNGNRLPPSVRPISFAFEGAILDKAKATDIAPLTINIASTMSIREAKKHAHLQHALLQKKLDIALLDAQREHLRHITKRKTFVDKCTAHHVLEKENWKLLDLDLSEDESDVRGISSQALEARITVTYKKLVGKAAEARAANAKKQAMQSEKKKLLLEKLVERNPEDYVDDAVDARIAIWSAKASAKDKTRMKGKPPKTLQRDKNTLKWQKEVAQLRAEAGVEVNPIALALRRQQGSAIDETFLEPKNGTPPGLPGAKGKPKGKSKGKSKGERKT